MVSSDCNNFEKAHYVIKFRTYLLDIIIKTLIENGALKHLFCSLDLIDVQEMNLQMWTCATACPGLEDSLT